MNIYTKRLQQVIEFKIDQLSHYTSVLRSLAEDYFILNKKKLSTIFYILLLGENRKLSLNLYAKLRAKS